MTHPSHKARFSDAGSFDEICDLCGATDRPGETALDGPCPKSDWKPLSNCEWRERAERAERERDALRSNSCDMNTFVQMGLARDHEAARAETAERERDKLRAKLTEATGRLCVNCGKIFPLDHDRTKPGTDCPSPKVCTIDMTMTEAFEHWRKKAHELQAKLAMYERFAGDAEKITPEFIQAVLNVEADDGEIEVSVDQIAELSKTIATAARAAGAAEERERCAKIADEHRTRIADHHPDIPRDDELAQGYGNAALNIAATIRKEKP